MSASQKVRTFSAPLERSGNALHWTIIRIPFDSIAAWGVRGQMRVKGTINGFEFRTSLFPTGDGRHYMVINKKMQDGSRSRPGMEAAFRIEPDKTPAAIHVPAELQAVLKSGRRLQRFFQSFPPSMQREICRHVDDAKSSETRGRRAERAAERLMETMEAERDLPPLFQRAFAANPQAAMGWQRMPRSHRRLHLLGIFYYQTPDARRRRLDKALKDMEGYAARRAGRS
jgi:uncharacterized protein YdeI (YjbR/CyaY-like superfamily)